MSHGKDPVDRKLLDLKAVSTALDVSPNTVRALVECGELADPVACGKGPKWDSRDVEEYLNYAKVLARVKRCQKASS